MQREEEAEARRAARHAEEQQQKKAPGAGTSERPGARTETPVASTWRRGTAQPPSAASPAPAPVVAAAAPSPATDGAPTKYRPGALRGAGGWRDREAARSTEGGGAPPRRPESPAVQSPPAPSPAAESAPSAPAGGGWRTRAAATEANGPHRTESATPPVAPADGARKDEDGFQAVPTKGVWRPSRGRGGRP